MIKPILTLLRGKVMADPILAILRQTKVDFKVTFTPEAYPTLILQGVPEKTLVSVQRPITQVWKQLLGQVGAVFKSSGYQLSFEPKKSRIM